MRPEKFLKCRQYKVTQIIFEKVKLNCSLITRLNHFSNNVFVFSILLLLCRTADCIAARRFNVFQFGYWSMTDRFEKYNSLPMLALFLYKPVTSYTEQWEMRYTRSSMQFIPGVQATTLCYYTIQWSAGFTLNWIHILISLLFLSVCRGLNLYFSLSILFFIWIYWPFRVHVYSFCDAFLLSLYNLEH